MWGIFPLMVSCSVESNSTQHLREYQTTGVVGAGKDVLLAPKPRSATDLSAFSRHLVSHSRRKVTEAPPGLSGRVALRQSLYTGILAFSGVPRRQIAPALRALVDPSSMACGGASCSRAFDLKPKDVEEYLDDAHGIASRDKVLAQPENDGRRKTILASLQRQSDLDHLSSNGLASILGDLRRLTDGEAKYLAYGFASTGCDYRAFYMAMALATQAIAPKAFYNLAMTGFKLMPVPSITWEYHVATAFTAGDKEYVIDPTFRVLGLADDTILAKDQWLRLSGPKKQGFWDPSHGNEPHRHFYFPGSFSLLENVRVREQGSTASLEGDQLAAFRANQERIRIGSFDDLPKFTLKDINEACRNMTFLLHKENRASVELQKSLIAHTEDLILKLDGLGKLDRNAIFECRVRH